MNHNEDLAIDQQLPCTSATTASAIGTGVDWSGYNEVTAVVHVGGMAASSTTLEAVLEESDAASNFVSVDSIELDQSDRNKSYLLKGQRTAASKKNARLRVQRGGSGASMIAGEIILSSPKQAPVE
jgi:hypothetical protein